MPPWIVRLNWAFRNCSDFNIPGIGNEAAAGTVKRYVGYGGTDIDSFKAGSRGRFPDPDGPVVRRRYDSATIRRKRYRPNRTAMAFECLKTRTPVLLDDWLR